MISFDLKCGLDHVFEVWFRSSASYDQQRDAGQISCPICGNTDVAKAVMAPAVSAKSNRRTGAVAPVPIATAPNAQPSEEQVKASMAALIQAQAKSLEQSRWVGDRFTDRARAMHYGEEDHAPIHGTARIEDARMLIEEGLAVLPLLVPVIPPDQTH